MEGAEATLSKASSNKENSCSSLEPSRFASLREYDVETDENANTVRSRLQWREIGDGQNFSTIDEAKEFVRGTAHSWHSGGVLRSGGTWKKFICVAHSDCKHFLRIWPTGAGFAVQQSGEHTDTETLRKRGLHNKHKEQVDDLVLANVGPRMVARRLQARDPQLPTAVLRRITKQIGNRRKKAQHPS